MSTNHIYILTQFLTELPNGLIYLRAGLAGGAASGIFNARFAADQVRAIGSSVTFATERGLTLAQHAMERAKQNV